MRMFNFACIAVLQREVSTDEEQEKPELIGFWSDREQAELAVRGREDLRARTHAKDHASVQRRFGIDPPGLPKLEYAYIPVKNLECSDLANLEEKLIVASELYFVGIGVQVD